MAAKKQCPACGSKNVRVESPKKYKYENIGLTDILLLGNGVTLTDCPGCETKTTTIHDELQLMQVIGMSILTCETPFTGEEIRYLRTLFEMTQGDLAMEAGVRRATVAEWEGKKARTIAKDPMSELGLRMVLLHQFYERVVESDYCALTEKHLDRLSGFAGSVVVRAKSMIKEKRQHKPLSIKRSTRKKDWVAEEPCFA